MLALCAFGFFGVSLFSHVDTLAQDKARPNGAKHLRISSVNDVLAFWHAEQHLYVKGDVGVASKQLDDLEQWLDENGRHWTVVLMQNADGESYRIDGETKLGIDAVEYALDHGLTNQTDFGSLEHPVTKETDGAVFMLCLEERSLSYFGSDAQINRSLGGEEHWKGELDQAAIRAMKSGGRVVDAVKDTVKLINRRLEEAIQREIETQRQREDAIKLAVEEAKQSILRLQTSVSEVDRLWKAFRESSPAATGALAKPPIDTWTAKLEHLKETTREDNIRASEKELAQLSNIVNQYLNSFADREGLDEHLERIEKAKKELAAGINNAAQTNLANIDGLLEKVQQSFRNGDLDLAAMIEKIDEELKQGQAAIDRETERVEKEAYTNMWIGRTSWD